MQQKRISRRALFRGVFSATKVVQQQASDTAIRRAVARPPTAVDEVLLTRLCDGCGKCQEACPQQLISMIDSKPELHLDHNFCTQCSRCQQACPTLALSEQCNSTGFIPVFADGCQRLLYGECEICAHECPAQAISVNAKRPQVNIARCHGCAKCKSVCPMNCIRLELAAVALNL